MMMKILVFLSFIFAAYAFEINLQSVENTTFFKKWKGFYKKEYNDFLQEELRYETWISNWKKVFLNNLAYDLNESSYKLKMNKFSDLNSTEFTRMMNGYRNDMRLKRKPGEAYLPLLNIDRTSLPEYLDWRNSGYVTEVKDQGRCGSCWAFSATGSLEGQTMRKTGKIISLSEQNLIDCSRPEGNQGCNGGLMDQAFEYIRKQGGIDTEESYPYEAKNGKCRYNETNRGAEDVGYVDIPSSDENALKEAVATIGPISVAIDANHWSFQLYSSGIYNEKRCSSTKLDHGVLVVGYGTENGRDYWLVKNSWGTDWGDNGYIKMSRGQDNQCGIATQASYPLV